MAKYRVGIVGLSGITTEPAPEGPWFFGGVHPHAHAACYANHPDTEVQAICDIAPAMFDRFDRLWGSAFPNARKYTDFREMLRSEQLDVISVVTPDHLHADVVVAAAESGVRGIYCEKPIATTLEDADRMIAAVEASGASMVVNHTRRWFADYQRAQELIHGGELGELSHIHAAYGGTRAMLFRNGTHLIDSVAFFAQAEPIWIAGCLDLGKEDYGPRYAGDGGRDPETDPGGSALVRFGNGVVASVFCSKSFAPEWEITLYCRRGSVRICEPGGIEVTTMAEDAIGGAAKRRIDVPQYRWTDGTAAIDELIGLMEGRISASQSSPRDARRTLGVMLGLLQSQDRGNAVVEAPFADAI